MIKIKSKILNNSFFSALQIIVTSFCYVIVYYIIIKNLGKQYLGVWSIITTLPIAISVFGSGVSGCILRYIPVYSTKKDLKSFNEIIFNGLIFNVILGGIIVILSFIFCVPLLNFLFNVKNVPLLYTNLFKVALITFFINFLSSIFSFTLDGLQLNHKKNKIIMLSSFILCISASISIHFWGLLGILYSQLLQSIIVIILTSVLVIRSKYFKLSYLRYNMGYFKLFFTYGQGFQTISICILLFEPISKYFLNKYFNLETVGIYDIVNRIIVQARTLIVSAIQVIVPVVSEGNESGNLDINKVFQKSTRGASLLSFLIFSTLYCLGILFLRIYDVENLSTFLYMSLLLALAYHFNIIISTAYSILIGLGKLKNVVISHVLGTIINIVLFYLFGKYLSNSLIVLPIAISIIVSSLWILFAFKRYLKDISFFEKNSDFQIKLFSILSILLMSLSALFYARINFIIFLVLSHILIISILAFKNEFLKLILSRISSKKT